VIDHLAGLRGGVDRARVERLCEDLDLDLGRRVGELSKGNRQKVGLVAAFMGEPEVMVLDEPTSGLDPVVQRTFHALVDDAVSRGATVLVSSHVLSEVQRVAHRAAVLRAGRVVDVVEVGVLATKVSRAIELRFADGVPATEIAALPGVTDVEVEGRVLRCRVAGSVDAVLKAAATHTVEAITSHEPDLEDLFMELVR
jgi:ABC-2 type transport system ATP-binding protein